MNPRMVPRFAVLATVLLIALTACGTSSDAPAAAPRSETGAVTASPGTSGAESPSTGATSRPTPKILRFSATTVEGAAFDAVDLAGRDVMFWFWAPWCSECRREAPFVAAAQKKYGSKVAFVGVAGLGPIKDMKSFIDDYSVGAFTHLADVDGELWQRFGVVQQPAYAFVDESGKVEVARGELGERGISDRITKLIKD